MSMLRAGICSALTPEVLARLKEAGIRTVTDFLIKNSEELSQKVSLPFTDLIAIRRVLLAEFAELPALGSNLYKTYLSSAAVLSTGYEGLNTLLDGGLYTGEVVELIGEPASGKTQICFRCAACLVEETKFSAVYLDTSGVFSGERLLSLLKEEDEARQDEMLSRIRCIQVHSIFEIFQALEEIRNLIVLQTDKSFQQLKLVIVDSVAAVTLPLLGSQVADGLSLLGQLGHKLKVMSVDFGLAVLVANSSRQMEDGHTVASLGRGWSHVPHCRLLLQRGSSCLQPGCALVKSCRKEVLPTAWLTLQLPHPEDCDPTPAL